MKNKKGFVVSAVLYPLLVLFLAIIMGLLSMTDTRKRILDKMKLEITDNIFDDAACSCDTILAKLNYIIANGTGGSGGDTGSYAYNKLTLNVKTYEAYSDFPVVGNIIGDIAVLSTTPIKNYYVSTSVPKSPQEGTVWIVQDNTSNYYVTSDWNRIGISYVMQYENSKWVLKKSYVYNGESWTMLYYVNLKNGYVDLTGTDINAQIEYNYDYTGEYQTFKAVFSGYYKIELWGAQGGSYNTKIQGGNGAYTSGEIYLNAGETIYIYVGGKGSVATSTTQVTPGGWNGGGFGIRSSDTDVGSSGGGATDIRLVSTTENNLWNEFESLKSRIMVAGGGGGSYYWGSNTSSNGGAGGTLNGEDGFHGSNHKTSLEKFQYAKGGSQTLGGSGVQDVKTLARFSTNGGFGYGGNSSDKVGTYQGSGGGSGYYGGGGSTYTSEQQTSAAGGSSYISGYEGCSSIEEESSEKNIIHNGSAYHYSGYYFINQRMETGVNSGNGKAKITLTTVEQRDKQEINNKIDSSYKYTYEYNGNYQIFKVPYDGIYKIKLYGAQGGSYSTTYIGGKGAYTTGNIYLTKGTQLYIYVGGKGTTTYSNKTKTLGGWNGGGFGIWSSDTDVGSSGGGATDIRLVKTTALDIWDEFESLKSRIMVASGGGGAYYWGSNTSSNGGSGGTLNGEDGFYGTSHINYLEKFQYAKGGSQTLGGSGVQDVALSARVSTSGGFGYGGSSPDKAGTYQGSGGGSGYYGGGGSTYTSSQQTSAAGGSSYISGYDGCSSIEEESTAINIMHNGSAYHYSNYYFESSSMESGQNEGNGSATIKLVEKKEENTNSKDVLAYNYYYNGGYQKFIVPVTGTYKVELWGAQGGNYSTTYTGGKGAYSFGNISLEKGTILYVYVGGKGKTTYSNYKKASGGWNGGGFGVWASDTDVGQSGGGATDIRLVSTSSKNLWNEFESLKSRIMVAAGGGGAYYWGPDRTAESGGYGGTIFGGNGLYGINDTSANSIEKLAQGGSQTLGGSGVQDVNLTARFGTSGGFGYGGDASTNYQGSGGGGGYYGGGGSTFTGTIQTSAAGGSSYISGYDGCSSVEKDSSYTDILHNGSIYHYSNYSFSNASMKENVNEGNGYAKITFIDKNTISSNNKDKNLLYYYSGTYQLFNVKRDGTYKIELWGAQGGSYNSKYYGGKGSYTSGEISLKSGSKLYIYVGGSGTAGTQAVKNATGGWNGGGVGVWYSTTDIGSSGGGATDVRVKNTNTLNTWNEPASLNSRIMVAGSGGGAYFWGSDRTAETGGSGGGLLGIDGFYGTNHTLSNSAQHLAKGGSQISGGKGVQDATLAARFSKAGGFGFGGDAALAYQGSGGGAGWYGGGGSTYTGSYQSSAAGGSSYISGHAGCIGVNSSGNPIRSSYTSLADSISYTNYKFANTQMIDGEGYPWTTTKASTSSGMSNPNNSSLVDGNTGNGYTKITYLGA